MSGARVKSKQAPTSCGWGEEFRLPSRLGIWERRELFLSGVRGGARKCIFLHILGSQTDSSGRKYFLLELVWRGSKPTPQTKIFGHQWGRPHPVGG